MLRNATRFWCKDSRAESVPSESHRVHKNNRIYHELVNGAQWDRARVARELRVSRSTVMRWARNSIVPEDSKLILLAQLTGQSVNLAGETISGAVPRESTMPVATLLRSVTGDLRKLPESKQRELLQGFRFMVNAVGAAEDPPSEAVNNSPLKPKPPARKESVPAEMRLAKRLRDGDRKIRAAMHAAASAPVGAKHVQHANPLPTVPPES